MPHSRQDDSAGRRQTSRARGDLFPPVSSCLVAVAQMATYSLAECLRMDFPRRFPRRLPRHTRRQFQQCLHQDRIVEGCAARSIDGSRRARCAATGQSTMRIQRRNSTHLFVGMRICEKVGVAGARIMNFAPQILLLVAQRCFGIFCVGWEALT